MTPRGSTSLFPDTYRCQGRARGDVEGISTVPRESARRREEGEGQSRRRHEIAGRRAARARDPGDPPEHQATTGNGVGRAKTRREDHPHGDILTRPERRISRPGGRQRADSWPADAVLVRRRPTRAQAKLGPCRKAGAAGTGESAEETSVADSEGAGRSRHEEDTRKRDVPGRSGMRSGARTRAARTPGTLRRTPCNRPPWRETTHENRACCEVSTPPGRSVFPRSRARHRLTRANAPCRALRRERLTHLYHREPRLGEDSPRFDRFSHVTY